MMPKLNSNNLVAQANKMIQDRYALTRNEKLLLQAMTSLINPKDQQFADFCVTLDELCEILNIERTSATREFKKVSNKLLKRIIEIDSPEHGWEAFQWVSYASVKDGFVYLKFHDKLKPYLLNLKKSGNFTQYRLWNVSGFRSTYSIRIYQILKEYYGKKIYTFELLLNDFKKMMLGRNASSYVEFKRFKVRVINAAQKELGSKNQETGLYKSDLGFDLETRRTGRKISHLIFTINTQQTKPSPKIQPDTPQTSHHSNMPQIILDYEAVGVMRRRVKPYLEIRGTHALQNTLNKFNDDKTKGKITKSEQGYLAYLLRANAGQETKQDREREQTEINKQRQKEKEAKEKAFKEAFITERETALSDFFVSLQEGELEYILVDFEASEIFEQRITSWQMLVDIYNSSKEVGLKDRDIKKAFHTFIIDQHLDKRLNNFSRWKEGKMDFS
jgi:plasmid replication initiation protein